MSKDIIIIATLIGIIILCSLILNSIKTTQKPMEIIEIPYNTKSIALNNCKLYRIETTTSYQLICR